MNFFRKTSTRAWTPSSAFPIGTRVVIVYAIGFSWQPKDVDLIGSSGVVSDILDVEGYQLVQLDEGFTMRCRPQVLRRVGDKPREDLKLGRWADCPWKPAEVRS